MTDPNLIAQQTVEAFTAAVWQASPLGRTLLMEIVARFFEDQAIVRAMEAHGGFRGKAAAATTGGAQ